MRLEVRGGGQMAVGKCHVCQRVAGVQPQGFVHWVCGECKDRLKAAIAFEIARGRALDCCGPIVRVA
jgi:hypothetical protein